MIESFELIPGKLYKLKKQTCFNTRNLTGARRTLEKNDIILYVGKSKDNTSMMYRFIHNNKLLYLWNHYNISKSQFRCELIEIFELLC